MNLKEKIREIIEKEKNSNHFSVLDSEKSVDLIAQIISNYEKLGKIKNLIMKIQNLKRKKLNLFLLLRLLVLEKIILLQN